ncbi:MAG: carbohydrate kinase family protein [Acidobacteriota bacterium]
MKEIVVLGDLCWDVYLGGMKRFPEMGVEVFADDGSMKPGGSAANTAMVLALCDCPVDLYGVVGDDSAGRRILQDLKGYGVDAGRISLMFRQQTGFTVVLSYKEKQERMLVTSPGTLDKAGLEDFNPGYLKNGAHLHLSSYFIQARLAPEIGGLLELAKMEGMTTSLDPGHDPAGEWDISGIMPFMFNLDWFLPNEIEFMSIAGGKNLVRSLEQFGPDLPGIVVKAGSEGAYLRLGNEGSIMHFPSLAVDVLDTTCAGDAFNAGFLLALSMGNSPGEAVLLGNRFGAACSSVMGLPRDKEFFHGLTR